MDRFVLVTLRGTNILLEDFGGLLDCARAAMDAADFEHRLETPGFVTGKAVHYCDEIRTIVSAVEGTHLTRSEIWSFLKVLHILVLDLHSSTRQTEAALKSLLAHTVRSGDTTAVAEASWASLLETASQGMAEARNYRHRDLPHVLRERHAPLGCLEQQVLRSLKNHSAIVLREIASTIGGNLHLPRVKIVQSVLGKLESSQVVILTGPAGSGKSAVAKNVVDRRVGTGNDAPMI